MTRPTVFASILILLLAWGPAVRSPGQGHPHGQMDRDCTVCHDESSWEVREQPPGFDHGTTGFALEGGHKRAGCRDCHGELIFAHVGSQCADCHTDIHLGRLGPVCSDCHGTDDWVDRPRMIQEHNSTLFPLVGAHERVDCDACHTGALGSGYLGTPTDCYFCHESDFNGTVDPDHRASDFGTDCRICHGVFASTWGAADFIHPGAFPLTGAHARLDCDACHVEGYLGTPTDCYACHQADYEGTGDPDHQDLLFPTGCDLCHTTSAWEPASYIHSSGFILSGEHAQLDCVACHVDGYVGATPDCFSCHESDFYKEHDDGDNIDCFMCHTTSSWEGGD